MSNVLLGFPFYNDASALYTPTYSGGAWSGSLPLTNLSNRKLHKLTRSSDDELASTRLHYDLGVARSVGLWAIPKHTMSKTGAYVRILGQLQTFLFQYEAGDDITAKGGTFARASTATYLDRNGILRTASSGVARDAHFIGGVRHLLLEMARTNVVLWNRDATNAAWTKTNVTAAKTQTGIDGSANSASLLTATAGNGTCLQAITLASSARYQSAFVKRVTGSGTVQMTMDNGATWTAITLTASWTRVTIPTQTLANPTVGFRIITNGDAIAVDYVQNENGIAPSSAIATTTVSLTRAADSLYFTYSALPQEMTVYAKHVELGSSNIANAGIANFGNAIQYVDLQSNGGGQYSFIQESSSGAQSKTAAGIPALGDTVENRGILGSTGTVAIGQSLNGAAEVVSTTSSATALDATFGTSRIYLGGDGALTQPGLLALQSVRVMAGTQTMVTMRASVYDSGWLDAWPSGLDAEEATGLNVPFVHIPSSAQSHRYGSIQIDDTANTAGYVDLARLVIAGTYQPTINYNTGAKLGLRSAAKRTESDGGAAIIEDRPVRRTFQFVLSHLTQSEGFTRAFQLQRRLGKRGQLFVIVDPADTTHQYEQAFLGTLEELSALEYPYTDGRTAMAFQLVEEL